MEYSVIYSCDVPRGVSLVGPPPSQSHLWTCTERSGGPDGEQMGWGFEDGSKWSRGRHRKYCAWLTEEQFEDFLDHTGIYAENVNTLGSIGAPGFGFGWAPAISFTSDDWNDRILNAYVTPVPDQEPPRGDCPEAPALPGLADVVNAVARATAERIWREVRAGVLERYGV